MTTGTEFRFSPGVENFLSDGYGPLSIEAHISAILGLLVAMSLQSEATKAELDIKLASMALRIKRVPR